MNYRLTEQQRVTPHCPYVLYFKACGGEDCVCCEIYREIQNEREVDE